MLQEILLGSLFVIGTVVLVALAYFAMRWLASHLIEDHTKDLAGSVIFRVSALHGLILALIFAQQMQGYQQLKAEVVAEATAIADIYNDIRRFDPEIAPSIQTSLARYLNVVVGEEWESIGAGRGTVGGAWQQWETVYNAILDLKPSNPRQESLRDHMLEDVQKIAEVRDQRQHQNAEAVSRYFWFAAISGIFLVSLAYFCFPAHGSEPDTALHLRRLHRYRDVLHLCLFEPLQPTGCA